MWIYLLLLAEMRVRHDMDITRKLTRFVFFATLFFVVRVFHYSLHQFEQQTMVWAVCVRKDGKSNAAMQSNNINENANKLVSSTII